MKSTYLLKNKEVFDVQKLDIQKFAQSFGLINPPRIRFLEKRLNLKTTTSKVSIENSSDSENDDDILTLKRTNHELDEQAGEEESEDLMDQKVKIVTKVRFENIYIIDMF